MARRLCFGCMQMVEGAVCPNCGCPEQGANAPDQVPVGSVLGGCYLVGRVISQNENGLTYISMDQGSGKTCLIREVPRGSAWERALGVFAGRDMSAVFAILSVFQENGRGFLVAEPPKGPSLSKYAAMKGGRLSIPETLRLLTPVLDAMAQLHDQGLFHGGLNMDSITLDPMGGAVLSLPGERPGSADRDVQALGLLLCRSLGSDRPEQIAGLTEDQAGALAAALQGRFRNAGALRQALAADVPPKAAPAAPVTQPQAAPAFARTEVVSPFKVEAMMKQAQLRQAQRACAGPAPTASGPQEEIHLGEIPLGQPRQDQGSRLEPIAPVNVDSLQAPVKKPRKGLIIGLSVGGGVLVLLIAAVTCFFTVHFWQEGSCTEPEKCTLCGKLNGEAPGHKWTGNDCDLPQTCSVCGEEAAQPLGHEWVAASCTAPKTCRHCGQTEGERLGHDWAPAAEGESETCTRCGQTRREAAGDTLRHVPAPQGKWVMLTYDSVDTMAFALAEPVEFATMLEMDFSPTFNYKTYVKTWMILTQNSRGEWVEQASFDLLEGEQTTHVTLEFGEPSEVYAIAVVPMVAGNYSYSFDLVVTDLYCLDK